MFSRFIILLISLYLYNIKITSNIINECFSESDNFTLLKFEI